jgi:ssRNA-specific RNase YbeY (16S rRNA maturation enzyme)
MILLSEAFANYYTTHLNHLLNPIKPEPMSSDLYRFCMGDLITVCKEFEPQKKVPEKKRSYFFVHHSLHMLEYNRKEVQV